jgi:hypothetical protein
MKLPSIEPRSGTSKNKDPYGFAFSENMSDWHGSKREAKKEKKHGGGNKDYPRSKKRNLQ